MKQGVLKIGVSLYRFLSNLYVPVRLFFASLILTGRITFLSEFPSPTHEACFGSKAVAAAAAVSFVVDPFFGVCHVCSQRGGNGILSLPKLAKLAS